MTRLPRLSARRLITVLRRSGFEVIRVKGSHHFLQHPDGRKTVVPVHAGEIVGPGLLAQILKDCKMSRELFRSLL
ncbi:MAG: type II toxin-antitoxin system HicA family toxin [Acidobacteria bacterium]|nr:type II toxin-antitoxin system HicA family toxin [Acidobacteriota bacterium]